MGKPVIERRTIRLLPREVEALRGAVALDRPAFEPRLAAGGLRTDQLLNPWFSTFRIIEVASEHVPPARMIHVALGPETGRVLSGNLSALNAIARHDPPPRIDTPEAARNYANITDFWTTESELGELLIGSLDEVPWYEDMDPVEEILIQDLAEQLAGQLGQPWIAPRGDAGGFVLVKWVVSNRSLIRRELHITPAGGVTRIEEVIDSELPVAPGRVWGMRGGRLVPIG